MKALRKLADVQIQAGSVTLAASRHPNKMAFKGVLVRLDEVSTRPPNGSQGHKIVVPSQVAASRLKTLIGMGLNYAPSLDTHSRRRKVGVIQKAWIDGKNLWVEGTVWKHDFPEAETDLKQDGLGMSMELGSVHVDDVNARVWTLNDFYFLGATILWKDAAAYSRTLAIAAQAERNAMTTKKKPAVKLTVKELISLAAAAATKSMTASLKPALDEQSKLLGDMGTRLTAIEAGTRSAKEDDEEVDDLETDDADDVDAAGKKPAGDDEDDEDEEIDDEDELDSAAVDTGDLEEMGPDTEDDADGDDTPGHMNKGSKNKGNKSASENKVGKNVNKGVTGSALAALTKQVAKLTANYDTVVAQNAKLTRQLKRQTVQVTAAAARLNRRSVSPELAGLLAKQGLSSTDLLAEGKKLTVQEIDAVIAASGIQLDPTARMTLKNGFRTAGLMEDGVVTRAR